MPGKSVLAARDLADLLPASNVSPNASEFAAARRSPRQLQPCLCRAAEKFAETRLALARNCGRRSMLDAARGSLVGSAAASTDFAESTSRRRAPLSLAATARALREKHVTERADFYACVWLPSSLPHLHPRHLVRR